MSRSAIVLLALCFTAASSAALAQGAAPQSASAPSPAAAQWQAIVADFEAHERRESPFRAGLEGDREALARLPDVTPAGDARRLAAMKDFARRLAALDSAKLEAEAKFNHAFLKRVVDERIEEARFDGARLAFDSEGGPGGTLNYFGRDTRIAGRADADAWMKRLAAMPGYFGDTIANARRGISTRFTQPRSTVQSAIELARVEVAIAADAEPLLQPFAKPWPGVAAKDQAAMRAEAARLVAEKIVPARKQWLAFLESEYLPAARAQAGLGSLDGGREYYSFLARSYTTTAMTPDEIHAVGQREVARIRAAMDLQVAASEFKGSFAEFLAWLRSDPRFYAKSRTELMEKASEMAKRADNGLPALFRKSLPRLPYGVRAVPREIEDQYTTGRYSSGSLQLGVAGGYLVNTGRLDQRPLYELPALTLHEAVPGHHLQISIAQELAEQPWFRRNADVTAFTEGWGLYSEYLGEEMGFYRDPFERFGRLSYEMWRACRLVADTGIHWMGWTVEQARACFRDNSALAPHNIETELQRYVGWPGQALGYKIGELKLKALRERASAALGDKFDVREFHDTLLLGGAMPLAMLEARVEAWISEKTAAP
ncbi:MAG: DUF885 family protein [Gammaproteobacteria bacterium]|nr:DUF885 family protein [Gammaproteobacteria bacterium]